MNKIDPHPPKNKIKNQTLWRPSTTTTSMLGQNQASKWISWIDQEIKEDEACICMQIQLQRLKLLKIFLLMKWAEALQGCWKSTQCVLHFSHGAGEAPVARTTEDCTHSEIVWEESETCNWRSNSKVSRQWALKGGISP